LIEPSRILLRSNSLSEAFLRFGSSGCPPVDTSSPSSVSPIKHKEDINFTYGIPVQNPCEKDET